MTSAPTQPSDEAAFSLFVARCVAQHIETGVLTGPDQLTADLEAGPALFEARLSATPPGEHRSNLEHYLNDLRVIWMALASNEEAEGPSADEASIQPWSYVDGPAATAGAAEPPPGPPVAVPGEGAAPPPPPAPIAPHEGGGESAQGALADTTSRLVYSIASTPLPQIPLPRGINSTVTPMFDFPVTEEQREIVARVLAPIMFLSGIREMALQPSYFDPTTGNDVPLDPDVPEDLMAIMRLILRAP